jgi:hypothetical protein
MLITHKVFSGKDAEDMDPQLLSGALQETIAHMGSSLNDSLQITCKLHEIL